MRKHVNWRPLWRALHSRDSSLSDTQYLVRSKWFDFSFPELDAETLKRMRKNGMPPLSKAIYNRAIPRRKVEEDG